MNSLKRSTVNWKTSTGGIASITAGVTGLIYAFANHLPITTELLTANIALIITGVSLLFARDSSVTSEQSGITPSQESVDKAKEVSGNPNPS